MHFLNFIKSELNNNNINWISASNINEGLLIHQKFFKLNIFKEILNKYIYIYVICSSCNSTNTLLNKFICKTNKFICLNCGMNKTL